MSGLKVCYATFMTFPAHGTIMIAPLVSLLLNFRYYIDMMNMNNVWYTSEYTSGYTSEECKEQLKTIMFDI